MPNLPDLIESSHLVARVEVLGVGDSQHGPESGEPLADRRRTWDEKGQRPFHVIELEVLEVLGPNGDFQRSDAAPARVLASAWDEPCIYRGFDAPSELGVARFEVGQIGYIAASAISDPQGSDPSWQHLIARAAEQAESTGARVRALRLDEWWTLREGWVISALYGFDFAGESDLRLAFAEVIEPSLPDPLKWQARRSASEEAVARVAQLFPDARFGTPIARLVRRWDAVAWRAEETPDPAVDDLGRLALGAWIVGNLGGDVTECDVAAARGAEAGRREPCDDTRSLEGVYVVLSALGGTPIAIGAMTAAEAATLEAMPSRAMALATAPPHAVEPTPAAPTATSASGTPPMPYPDP
ncbi:MAG: hypothetical protein H6648_02220 [Caldilineae bacterium]|nr:hypothetical protein [Caldilineae bacterium]